MRGLSSLALVSGMAVLAGCGPSDPHNRQAVSGKVSIKGQPVKFGTIIFEPQGGQQVSATANTARGRVTSGRPSSSNSRARRPA